MNKHFLDNCMVKRAAWIAALLPPVSVAADNPNIIIIMADDMGYSDVGCYGGEIHTPSIDSLAENGIRYTCFYNGARSCPTRAALMTGLYAHKAGMGWMAAACEGEDGYRGDLSENALTLAEYLKSGGYTTYMSGKWHLSNHQKNDQNIKDNWPRQRGFDHFFGIIGGAANYFTPGLVSNNKRYSAPSDFYMTDAISDTAVAYIHAQGKSKPFFMYVAYTAPHWPLQARPSDIAKYAGQYSIGWDQVRQNRLKKQKAIGLIDDRYELSPRDAQVNAWNNESQKNDYAKRMEIYAAQIDVMDEGIGRIVQALKDNDAWENTLIFFLSDNGACAEMISSGESKQPTGEENTYESYRRAWANVSNTPYREYKHFAHEGGVKSPLIVHWPAGIACPTGGYEHSNAHLIDIYKTIADITQIPYPAAYNGNTIIPLQGSSFLPNFRGTATQRGPVFWEHEGNIAVRMGDWKLVTKSGDQTPPGTLELYNLAGDPTELHNLAASNPQKVQELWNDWLTWATENDVFPLSTLNDNERSALEPRYLNGEFNAGLFGWTLNTAGTGAGTLSLNTSSLISGKYSAEIVITQTGAKPNNLLLYWALPLKQGERCKLRFKAKASKAVNMLVRLEKNGDTFAKIIDESVDVTTSVKTWEFDSTEVPATEGNRIGFYFGSSAPATVWLDEVELIFINQEALSPSWDFAPVADASYKLSFEGKGAQLWTPVKVFLRKADAPSEICFSQTVYFTSAFTPFELSLPDMPAGERLFIQFEYPAWASKDCRIQNIALDVSGTSALPENARQQSPYRMEYMDLSKYRVFSSENKSFKAELFSLQGDKLDEQQGKDLVLSLKQNLIYILRLSGEKTGDTLIRKLCVQ